MVTTTTTFGGFPSQREFFGVTEKSSGTTSFFERQSQLGKKDKTTFIGRGKFFGGREPLEVQREQREFELQRQRLEAIKTPEQIQIEQAKFEGDIFLVPASFNPSFSPEVRALNNLVKGGIEDVESQLYNSLASKAIKEARGLEINSRFLDKKISDLNKEGEKLDLEQQRLQRLAYAGNLNPQILKNQIDKFKENIADYESKRKDIVQESSFFNTKVAEVNLKLKTIDRVEGTEKNKVFLDTVKILPNRGTFSTTPQPTLPTLGTFSSTPINSRFGNVDVSSTSPVRVVGAPEKIPESIVTGIFAPTAPFLQAPTKIGTFAFRGAVTVGEKIKESPVGQKVREVIPFRFTTVEPSVFKERVGLFGGELTQLGAESVVGGALFKAGEIGFLKGGQIALGFVKGKKAKTFVELGFKDISLFGQAALVTGAGVQTIQEFQKTETQPLVLSSKLAVGLVGFGFGAKLSSSFFKPIESGILRETQVSKLSKTRQEEFRESFAIAKEFEKEKIKVREIDFFNVEKLTPKAAKVLRTFVSKKKGELIIGGSVSQQTQVSLRLKKQLPKPSDVDIFAKKPIISGREFFKELKSAGVERVSKIEKGGRVEITIGGKKAIEFQPRERLFENISEVRGIFEFSKEGIVKTPSGIQVLSLKKQAQRKVIGGYLAGRPKDIEQFNILKRSLPAKRIEAAKASVLKPSFFGERGSTFNSFLTSEAGRVSPFLSKGDRFKLVSEQKVLGIREPVQGVSRKRGENLVDYYPSKKSSNFIESYYPQKAREKVFTYSDFESQRNLNYSVPKSEKSIYPNIEKASVYFKTPKTPAYIPPINKNNIYFSTPVKPIGYVPPPSKGSIYVPPPSKGSIYVPPPSKGSIYVPPPSKGRIYVPPPSKGRIYVPPPPTKIKIPLDLPDKDFDFVFGSGERDAFDVFVRKRKVFSKVNKKPLPKNRALNFGGKIVDQSPAASFRIRQSKKPSKEADDLFFFNAFKFRPSKRDVNTFIEKEIFRIDSAGEVRGIPIRAKELRQQQKLFGINLFGGNKNGFKFF